MILFFKLADDGGIEPLSSFPLFYATALEELCGYVTLNTITVAQLAIALSNWAKTKQTGGGRKI